MYEYNYDWCVEQVKDIVGNCAYPFFCDNENIDRLYDLYNEYVDVLYNKMLFAELQNTDNNELQNVLTDTDNIIKDLIHNLEPELLFVVKDNFEYRTGRLFNIYDSNYDDKILFLYDVFRQVISLEEITLREIYLIQLDDYLNSYGDYSYEARIS